MICPRAQTCMDSKVVRADFWRRTDIPPGSPPGSNMLRAEIQRTIWRAPRQLRRLRLGLQTRRGSNQSAANMGESNSRSTVFQFGRTSTCVPSRWKVLSGEFRRRPTELAIELRKSDRVGRRGLSEPREDFPRLTTYAIPRLYPSLYRWLYQSHFNLRSQLTTYAIPRLYQPHFNSIDAQPNNHSSPSTTGDTDLARK